MGTWKNKLQINILNCKLLGYMNLDLNFGKGLSFFIGCPVTGKAKFQQELFYKMSLFSFNILCRKININENFPFFFSFCVSKLNMLTFFY